jgi:hypothetical protein
VAASGTAKRNGIRASRDCVTRPGSQTQEPGSWRFPTTHYGDQMRLDVGIVGVGETEGEADSGGARPRTKERVAASTEPRVIPVPRRASGTSSFGGPGPRLLDRDAAAKYLSVSVDTVDRLLQSGALHVVRLPVQRDRKTGLGVRGTTRRILVDRHELDSLVDRCREVLL